MFSGVQRHCFSENNNSPSTEIDRKVYQTYHFYANIMLNIYILLLIYINYLL